MNPYRRSRNRRPLFSEGDLQGTLRNHLDKVEEKVKAIPEAKFLASPVDRIVEHVVAEMQVEPIQLHEDAKEMERDEVDIDVSHSRSRNPFGDSGPIEVPGTRVTVSIPWTGDELLWKLRPSSYRTRFPHAEVRGTDSEGVGQLDVVIEKPADVDPKEFKKALQDTLGDIKFYLEKQAQDIEGVNEKVRQRARQAAERRRGRLDKHDEISEVLDIALKRDDDAPSVEPVKVKRKLVRPLPETGGRKSDREPGIRQSDYEHILKVIRHEGRTFEATPNTYAVHDEEGLRDILLAHLNGHYEGSATGETFRKQGKTDIRIEDRNRAAFVAECKVWEGPVSLEGAVDQLLGYLTWRDCKAAIIIFNQRNKGFAKILQKIPTTLQDHPQYIAKDRGIEGEAEWRLRIRAISDEDREVIVHVFAFDLYVSDA